jgi:hypothetical protein
VEDLDVRYACRAVTTVYAPSARQEAQMMKTKFEIKKVGGGHEVTCFHRGMVKNKNKGIKIKKWVQADRKKFWGDGSRYCAREFGRDFVRECE